MHAAVDCLLDVLKSNGFGGVVADSAGRPQEDHRGGNFFGEDHSIVTGATRHAMRLTSGPADRFFDLVDKEWIHRDALLVQQYVAAHGESAALGNFLGSTNELIQGTDADLVGAVTNVERE